MVKVIGSNIAEVTVKNATILISYATPVAAYVEGRGFLRTATNHSATTNRHANKWLVNRNATRVIKVDQTELDELLGLS